MKKNLCKVKIGNEQGSGFFCKIPFPSKDKWLPVFITNNHVINNNTLFKNNESVSTKVKDQNIKKFNLNNRMKYTNEEYDITIVEIKEEF